jgi:hypothetical protein
MYALVVICVAIIVLIIIFWVWRNDNPVYAKMDKTIPCVPGINPTGKTNSYIDGPLSDCEKMCSGNQGCEAFTQENASSDHPNRCYFYTATGTCCNAQKANDTTTLYYKKPWYQFWNSTCTTSGKFCPTQACS